MLRPKRTYENFVDFLSGRACMVVAEGTDAGRIVKKHMGLGACKITLEGSVILLLGQVTP